MDINHLDIKLAAVVAIGLIVFGLWYNDAVARWQRQDGGIYNALYVTGGVLVTLTAGAFVIGFDNFAVMFVLFGCSGVPMLLGSMARHRREAAYRKHQSTEQARREIDHAREP